MVMQALQFEPAMGTSVMILATGVAAGLTIMSWWRVGLRGARGWGALLLRLLAVAGFGVLLAGPSVQVDAGRTPQAAGVALLVDRSRSMQSPDAGPDTARIAAAQRWLDAVADLFPAGDGETIRMGFGQTTSPLPGDFVNLPVHLAADRDQTRLLAAIAQTLDRLAPAATSAEDDRQAAGHLVILSDGRSFDDRLTVQTIARRARAAGIKLHFVPLGGADAQFDLALTAETTRDRVRVGQPVQVHLSIAAVGVEPQRTTLRITDTAADATHTHAIDLDQPLVEQTVTITPDRPGLNVFELQLDTLPDEAAQDNNTQTVFVDAVDTPWRIMLLEGRPGWTTRFLGRSLATDPTVQLSRLIQLGPQRQLVDGGPDGQDLATQITRQDTIILGRGLDSFLTDQAMRQLRRFVADGGTLVLARGVPTLFRSTGPLAALAPLDEAKPRATARELNVADWAETTGTTNAPTVLAMPYGAGQVVAVLGDDTWRWAMQGDHVGQRRFDAFWGRLVRHRGLSDRIGPGRDWAATLSRRTLEAGEPVRVDVVFRQSPPTDVSPTVRWSTPDTTGQLIALTPTDTDRTHWQASIRPQTAGRHELRIDFAAGEPSTQTLPFEVRRFDRESLITGADRSLLRSLASATGGKVLNWRMPRQLDEVLTQTAGAAQRPPRTAPVWDQPLVLVGLVSLLAAAWFLGRKPEDGP